MKGFAQLMILVPVYFERLAQMVIGHRSIIYILSFTVTAFASFTMWTAFRRIKSEKWMKYFSWAFGALAVQYGVSFLIYYITAISNERASNLIGLYLPLVVVSLLSVASNLCFIAAARDLENKRILLPRWCWGLAVASLITTIAGYTLSDNVFTSDSDPTQFIYAFLGRIFDAGFSAYSLFFLGYAVLVNLSFRRRPLVSLTAFILGGLYAMVQIAYGLSPLVAGYFVGRRPAEGLYLFDTLLSAIALPLRLGLFASAYLLVTRFFDALNELTNLQGAEIHKRQDYLSSTGVIRVISEKLRADVNLFIRMPGGDTDKRVARISWPDEHSINITRIFEWGDVGSSVREVLTEEDKRLIVEQNGNGRLQAIVSVAIESHGAAIGCLQIARAGAPFSHMAIRQIREIAHLVSPAVQAYRELAALDLISIRLTEELAAKSTFHLDDHTLKIAEALFDIFSPVAMRLQIDFGFTSVEPIYIGTKPLISEMRYKISWDEWSTVPETVVDRLTRSYQFFKKQLTARVLEPTIDDEPHDLNIDRFIIGNLVIAVNDDRDRYDRPALGTNYLHRKTASTLVADAYLDFARDYHSELMKRLGEELSHQHLNLTRWFALLAETVRAAGLSWVAAQQRERDIRLGDEESWQVVQSLGILDAEDRGSVSKEIKITQHQHSPIRADSNHILQLDLPISKGTLWLGVTRRGFGPELAFNSPWRNFLIQLAQIADSALLRITAEEEFQRMQIEAAQYQGLATVAVTTGTLIHQLSNQTHGQLGSILTLLDALQVGRLKTEEDIVQLMHHMKASAEQMQNLLFSLTNVTKIDYRRPCQLLDAAAQARTLFATALLQKAIELEIDVKEDVLIDVPFNVAALALANLVGNAKDAMKRGGTIRIEAESQQDTVLCRVIDEGAGVPENLRGRLFHLGTTSRANGSGWGLYLTKRSLLENRSHIELTKSDETGSIFTLRFPKATKEEA